MIEHTGETVEKLAGQLGNIAFGGSENYLRRTLEYLLPKQTPEGEWGMPDKPELAPCDTGQMILLLHRLGVGLNESWPLVDRTQRGSVRKALDWLEERKSGPIWPVDLWDTCQILKAFYLYDYKTNGKSFQDAIGYLKEEIESSFSRERRREWFGPGLVAGCLEVMLIAKQEQIARKLVSTLESFQNGETGAFTVGVPRNGKGEFRILPEWHTTLAVAALHQARGSLEVVSRALEWLKRNQHEEDGSWGRGSNTDKALYTCRALIAIANVEGSMTEGFKRGINFLLALQREQKDGRVGWWRSTIVAAHAFTHASVACPVYILDQVLQLCSKTEESKMPGGKLFEITGSKKKMAYILFMDTVGFSALDLDQQVTVFKLLNEFCAKTQTMQESQNSDYLILPTGDGLAVVFHGHNGLAPLSCAMQMQQKLKSEMSKIEIRQGIHLGQINILQDSRGNENAIGPAMNTAARVMDVGDAKHILSSSAYYKACVEKSALDPIAHRLDKSFIAKHDEEIGLYNYYQYDSEKKLCFIGNQETPRKLAT